MPSIESLQRKIKTATDLKSLVKTMKALAAVNIREYEQAAASIADYYRTVELGFEILLRNRPEALRLLSPVPPGPMGAVVFGTDQGLCGPVNDNIINYALSTLDFLSIKAQDRLFLAVGARAEARLEDRGNTIELTLPVPASVAGITSLVQEVLLHLEEWHSQGRVTSVSLFYNRHVSGPVYQPYMVRLLPIDSDWLSQLSARKWPVRNIPSITMDWKSLFTAMTTEYFFVTLYRAFAESLASENASRLASMQNAENNIDDRLTEFSLQYQQERQRSITEELLDIISGFEALTAK